MVIDFNKLDKRKSYVVLEYGTSKISKIINKLTKEFFEQAKNRPSHVLALKYNGYCWQIYESHLAPILDAKIHSGTRVYSQYVFEACFPKIMESTGEVYPLATDINILKKNLNKPYGVKDIIELADYILSHHRHPIKDGRGFICSEYIATASPDIRKYFKNLKPNEITPAHFLKYFKENNIPPVDFS